MNLEMTRKHLRDQGFRCVHDDPWNRVSYDFEIPSQYDTPVTPTKITVYGVLNIIDQGHTKLTLTSFRGYGYPFYHDTDIIPKINSVLDQECKVVPK